MVREETVDARTFEYISSDVLFVAGPHTAYDEAVFCEMFVDALT